MVPAEDVRPYTVVKKRTHTRELSDANCYLNRYHIAGDTHLCLIRHFASTPYQNWNVFAWQHALQNIWWHAYDSIVSDTCDSGKWQIHMTCFTYIFNSCRHQGFNNRGMPNFIINLTNIAGIRDHHRHETLNPYLPAILM